MQPAEIQALLRDAFAQGLSYQWWTFALALIGSGLGGYIAAYLSKKAEARVAREEFESIRVQLRTTTKDTEEIKTLLSSEAWKNQRHWTAREEFYGNLLSQLHLVRIALEELSDYYVEPGSEHIPDNQQSDRFRKLLSDCHAPRNEVRRLLGPAALFLSSKAVKTLNDFEVKHWDLINFEAMCTADYVRSAQTLVQTAYVEVLAEARRQLAIAEDDA